MQKGQAQQPVERYLPSVSQIDPTMKWLRVAIALNNEAVDLLQHGFAGEALRAFQTLAVCLAKENGDDDHDVDAEASRDLLAFGLARARATKEAAAMQESDSSLVDVIAVHDDDEDETESATIYGPSTCVMFPIKVCTEGLPFEGLHSNTSYIISVSLYNHGVATRCRSVNENRENMMDRAQESFHMCRKLLLGLKHNLSETSDNTRFFGIMTMIGSQIESPFRQESCSVENGPQVRHTKPVDVSDEEIASKKNSLFPRLRKTNFIKTAFRKLQFRASAA